MNDLFYWEKHNVSFSQYLDFLVFDDFVNLKIYDVIIDITAH